MPPLKLPDRTKKNATAAQLIWLRRQQQAWPARDMLGKFYVGKHGWNYLRAPVEWGYVLTTEGDTIRGLIKVALMKTYKTTWSAPDTCILSMLPEGKSGIGNVKHINIDTIYCFRVYDLDSIPSTKGCIDYFTFYDKEFDDNFHIKPDITSVFRVVVRK